MREFVKSGASNASVAQMGWEQRGSYQYYYKKERSGASVKSVYVGRGGIARMVSQLQSSSAELEELMKARRSIESQ